VSPRPVVRRHAVNVIGQRRLGAAVGRRVLPVLARLPVDDPDALVRRLAVVGLWFWGRQALPHLGVGRAATHDPDPTVRQAAESWLRDAGADHPSCASPTADGQRRGAPLPMPLTVPTIFRSSVA
jgi:hypothetical protein